MVVTTFLVEFCGINNEDDVKLGVNCKAQYLCLLFYCSHGLNGDETKKIFNYRKALRICCSFTAEEGTFGKCQELWSPRMYR